MSIFIGCSPSTGSSLLCQILNRHSKLYCGPESNLFIHPDLYTDWNNSKKYINSKLPNFIYGFKDIEFSLQPNIFLNKDMNRVDTTKLINSSNSLEEFSSKYFSELLSINNKDYWIEKTPANTTCFNYILDNFSDPTLIMIVRNPLDTIYSLLRRGMTIYRAVSVYLLYTAYGLSIDQTIVIHYEDLVKEPQKTLQKLFESFAVDYEKDIIKADNGDSENVKMEGWTYAENSKIRKGAINRFDNADKQLKRLVLSAIDSFYINENYIAQHSLNYSSIRALSDELGYNLSDFKSSPSQFNQLKNKVRKEQLHYLWRRFKIGMMNYSFSYPIVLRS